jgi:hypothetical protein
MASVFEIMPPGIFKCLNVPATIAVVIFKVNMCGWDSSVNYNWSSPAQTLLVTG